MIENLDILNGGDEPTFVTVSRRGVLDITFCNKIEDKDFGLESL